MKITLTVYPDGKSIVACPPNVSREFVEQLRAAWDEWRKTPEGLLMFSGEMIRAETVELDLLMEPK